METLRHLWTAKLLRAAVKALRNLRASELLRPAMKALRNLWTAKLFRPAAVPLDLVPANLGVTELLRSRALRLSRPVADLRPSGYLPGPLSAPVGLARHCRAAPPAGSLWAAVSRRLHRRSGRSAG